MIGDYLGQVRWDIHGEYRPHRSGAQPRDGVVGMGLKTRPLDPRAPSPVLLVGLELDRSSFTQRTSLNGPEPTGFFLQVGMSLSR
jgi:hypothetical protein